MTSRRASAIDVRPATSSSAISVATLTGEVFNYRSRHEAEKIAWSTSASKVVVNKIEVAY